MQLKPQEQARLDELNAKGYVRMKGTERTEWRTLKAMREAPEAESKAEETPKARRSRKGKAKPVPATAVPTPTFSDAPAQPAPKTTGSPATVTAHTALMDAIRIPAPGQRFTHAKLFDSIDPRVHSQCVVIAADADQVAYAGYVGPTPIGQMRPLGSFPTAQAASHVREWV